jgi:GntR family transcriptional repressor for pyruvate dehydrogenase complex
MYTAVRASRLYQQIVEQIEQSIRAGQLKSGDQLPAERELAEQFGVSRTAVREAVKTLCEKGLVEASPGRGTFIIDDIAHPVRQSLALMFNLARPEDAAFLVDVRTILEPEIAARAAARAEDKHVVALREALAVMDANLGSADAFIEADLDFHLALAEATQNPLVLALIDSIVGLLREQRTRIFDAANGPSHGLLHHRSILDAVERRDPDAARLAMRAHLSQVASDSEAGLVVDTDTKPVTN